jgi:hypothetical protein
VRTDRGGQILRTLDPKQLKKLEDIFQCEIDREQIHRPVPDGKSPRQKLMHAMGLLEVADEMTPLEKTAKELAYEERWYTHWDVLRSTIDIAALQNEHVKGEYTALSDIYHSLGATRTAVTVAWMGVCIISLSHMGRVVDAPLKALGGLVLISALTAGLSFVLHRARGRTWRSAAASLALGLRWLHWQEEHPSGEAQAAT